MDMIQPREIVKIDLYRRWILNAADTKTVICKVNDNLLPADDPSWKEIGRVVFSTVRGENTQTLEVAPEMAASGRYLLLYLPDSNRSPYVQLSEIDIYVR
jgi:hypothetical protein